MMHKKTFDTFADNYVHLHNRHLPPGVENVHFFEQKRDWVRELLSRMSGNPPSIRCLDFGCGVGSLCSELAREEGVSQVVGVDESEESRRRASEAMAGSKAATSVAERLSDVAGSRFDLITVFNVLHHVEPGQRPREARELVEALAPGGVLAIWEHNPWNPLTRFLIRICPFDRGVKLLWKSETIRLFRDPGLELVCAEYVNVTPPSLHRFGPLAWLERVLSRLPVGAQYRLIFRKRGSRS